MTEKLKSEHLWKVINLASYESVVPTWVAKLLLEDAQTLLAEVKRLEGILTSWEELQ